MNRLLVAVAAAIWWLTACGSSKEIVVKTADGVEITAKDIDANPLSLLPGGALLLANVQPKELFQSSLGGRFRNLAAKQFPLPPSAQFEPERDLERLLIGAYSMQGLDLAGVAVGNFNPEAIAEAARRGEMTPLGAPLVRVSYSHWEFYVAANLGFCVLTPRTVLFGNEIGMRRALDRLERGEIQVQQEPDLVALLERPGAPIAVGASNADGSLDVLAQRVPSAKEFTMARVVANLQPPGLNVAGTLTFTDAPSAERARNGIDDASRALQTLSTVGALLGLDMPIRKYESRVLDSSVQVTLGADSAVAIALMDAMDALLSAHAAAAHGSSHFSYAPGQESR